MVSGKREKFFWWMGPAALCVLLFSLPGCSGKRGNAYTYNLEDLSRVPAAAVCYRKHTVLSLAGVESGGLAVDGDRLYVTIDSQLLVLNTDAQLLQQIQLPQPAGSLAVGKERLYLGMTDHVEVYDTAGRPLETWAPLGEKALLTSLACSDSELLAADAGNHAVLRYTFAGRLLGRLTGILKQESSSGFIIPSPYFDVVAAANSIWITNPGRCQVEQYASEGTKRGSWGDSGFDLAAFAGCCNPIHITRLDNGNFVTAEKGLARIKLYDPEGEFLCVVAAPAEFSEHEVFADIAAGSNGLVYVLTSAKPALYVFKPV